MISYTYEILDKNGNLLENSKGLVSDDGNFTIILHEIPRRTPAAVRIEWKLRDGNNSND